MELSLPFRVQSCSSCQLPNSRIRVFKRTPIPSRRDRPFLSANSHKLGSVDAQRAPLRASVIENNGSPATSSPLKTVRIGDVKRVTKETDVFVKITLDGSGAADIRTNIPFLDHMLDPLASHGLFDVHVRASGDTHIDDHHTNEDVALAIGTALLQALGDRKGISRFGDFSAPLDEALIHVSLLVEHFFQSLVNTSGMALHIRQLAGKNSHHIVEATFKAFSRALRQLQRCSIVLDTIIQSGSQCELVPEFSEAIEIEFAIALREYHHRT